MAICTKLVAPCSSEETSNVSTVGRVLLAITFSRLVLFSRSLTGRMGEGREGRKGEDKHCFLTPFAASLRRLHEALGRARVNSVS